MSKLVEAYELEQEKILSSEWAVGFHDRGMGAGSFGVIVKDVLIIGPISKGLADHLVNLHNESL